MKRLLLIAPIAPHSMLGGDLLFRMPTLSLLKVAALTPAGWEVVLVDEKVEPLDLTQGADLVAITAMTTTANRGYQIADHFRARNIKVVMGGMHPSKLPTEALQHCDSVVIGEAEELWPRVLNDFDCGRLQPRYDHHGDYPALTGLPLPNWELYRKKKYLPVHFVETTRGCPHDCEFCAVTHAFGGKYRNRPVAEVDKELRSLKLFDGRFSIQRAVFFVDDNIIGNRAHARELLSRIADLQLNWFAQTSVNIARDDEILKLCQQSGCVGLFIGFETLSPDSLKGAGKNWNLPQNYFDVIQKIHDHGIGIDGSFVFGFDEDDESVFDRTLEFVLKAKLEIGYFSILTPYPGTRFYDRIVAENRLLTTNWDLFDASRTVFRPKQMTPERLQAGFNSVLKECYSTRSVFRRLWGTTAMKNFFWPMNFGFRQSARKMLRAR